MKQVTKEDFSSFVAEKETSNIIYDTIVKPAVTYYMNGQVIVAKIVWYGENEADNFRSPEYFIQTSQASL